jgi:hypothetical protein
VKLGLYRTHDPLLGEAARVHPSAGDAAPYLSRYLYELLDFRPAFDSLPQANENPQPMRPTAGASAAPSHFA